MKNSFLFIPLMLICVAMILVAATRRRSYTVDIERKITHKTITTVTHTANKDSLITGATKTLFNRETKEMLDMDGNVMFIADTFFVDDNNRVIKIIETLK